MREIKFRAWDNGAKTYKTMAPMMDIHTGEISNLLSRFIVEQFTGLRDKNGKEIYEGDIVKQWIDYGPGGEGLHITQVYITSFGPTISEWEYKEDGYLPEVIGNIHENPELLTGHD